MIKNERQYKITRAWVDKFTSALSNVTEADSSDVPALQRKAEIDGLASQLDDLKAQLAEYDALKAGKYAVLEIGSLAELPDALVRARIAAGMTQKELADKLGLKEQQIQKYESTGYSGANIERLHQVSVALNIQLREDLILPRSLNEASLFKNLRSIGLEKDFVLRRLVSPMSENVTSRDATMAHAVGAVSRVFGLTPAAIVAGPGSPYKPDIVHAARYSVRSGAAQGVLVAYTVYAHFLAANLAAVNSIPVLPIPTSHVDLRQAVVKKYGNFSFESVLNYAWDIGVTVLPLNDSGAFNGAYWRMNGRHVVVLKQQTRSTARWLNDLVHELFHASLEPDADERTVVEHEGNVDLRNASKEEQLARIFAGDAILDGRAEELVDLCVQRTGGRLQRLSSVVGKVAADNGVATDALANYLAFRLSLQGENWWGAATNLQDTKTDPWEIARDILLSRIDLGRLHAPDRELMYLALSGSGR